MNITVNLNNAILAFFVNSMYDNNFYLKQSRKVQQEYLEKLLRGNKKYSTNRVILKNSLEGSFKQHRFRKMVIILKMDEII